MDVAVMNVTPKEAAWNEETRRIMALSDWTSGVKIQYRPLTLTLSVMQTAFFLRL